MAFTRFVTKVRSFAPKVSIWARGQIGFNRGATEKFHLDQYGYAILYFDSDTRRIGIQLTSDEKEAGAIKITKRTSSISFSAKGFLQYHDIPCDNTKMYDVVYSDDDKMYIVQLD